MHSWYMMQLDSEPTTTTIAMMATMTPAAEPMPGMAATASAIGASSRPACRWGSRTGRDRVDSARRETSATITEMMSARGIVFSGRFVSPAMYITAPMPS